MGVLFYVSKVCWLGMKENKIQDVIFSNIQINAKTFEVIPKKNGNNFGTSRGYIRFICKNDTERITCLGETY